MKNLPPIEVKGIKNALQWRYYPETKVWVLYAEVIDKSKRFGYDSQQFVIYDQRDYLDPEMRGYGLREGKPYGAAYLGTYKSLREAQQAGYDLLERKYG